MPEAPDGAQPADPAPPTAAAGLRAIVGDDFSLTSAIGGWRGLVESIAPGLAFVVVYIATRELAWPLVAAGAILVVIVVARLATRSSLQQAFAGAIGVVVGVVWASVTGKAENFYIGGLLANAGYLLAAVASILVGWPLLGFVAGVFRGEATAWRNDRGERRRAAWATWLWAGMFAARLAVQLPMYYAGQVAWLGAAKLAMGVPLTAIVAWVSWLLLRRPKTDDVAPAVEAPGTPTVEGDAT